MLKNYLKIASRSLVKRPGYTAINVVGLAVGIACCVLLLLYVHHETSYDRHHDRAERIFRVVQGDWAPTQPVLGPTLAQDFPEAIDAMTRFYRFHGSGVTVRAGDARFLEPEVSFADSTVFDLFTYPFLHGDPRSALVRPETIVLTRSTALRYFGETDVVGRSVHLFRDETPFEITGVVEDPPPTSYHQFGLLGAFVGVEPHLGEMLQSWNWSNFMTYVLLAPEATAEGLNARLPAFFERHTGRSRTNVRLQPLTEIYLDPQRVQEWYPTGNRRYVTLLAGVAVLILVLACVNFMNLATARASERAREVGLRKALGAHRAQLVGQFLGEALLTTLLALGLGLVIVEVALPWFGELAGKPLSHELIAQPRAILPFALFVLAVGLVAGSYPALVLSGFQPVQVLKGEGGALGGARLRRMLVVVQFAASIALFASALLVHRQLDFMQERALGFDRAQLVRVPTPSYPLFKEQLASVPAVEAVSGSNRIPGFHFDVWPFHAEGRPPDSTYAWHSTRGDFNFFEMLGVEIVEGRDFDASITTDSSAAYIVNQAAAEILKADRGWETVLGKAFAWRDFGDGTFNDPRPGHIIGVARNFHYTSLHEAIQPLVFHVDADPPMAVLRLAAGSLPGALDDVRAVHERLFPTRPFSFTFVDDQFDTLYRAEARLAGVFDAFTGLALLIACLGLFGLAAFTAERRTKEIGVRKVLGASTAALVVLLTREFLRLVGIAFVVACPVAFLAMERWLDAFAYRIEVGASTFVTAGVAAAVIALATVGYQAVRTARTNPADVLRYE